jgi:hypothetical protein
LDGTRITFGVRSSQEGAETEQCVLLHVEFAELRSDVIPENNQSMRKAR